MGTTKINQLENANALFATGATKKEISQIIGVTEKTVKVWFDKWQSNRKDIEQAINNIGARLATDTDTLTPQQIKDLTYSLVELKRMI